MANPTLDTSLAFSTIVDASQHSIVAENTIGTFYLQLDLTLLADGDVLYLFPKQRLRASDAAQQVDDVLMYCDAQPTNRKIATIGPLINTNATDADAVEITYMQPLGTSRALTGVWQKFS